MKETDHEFLIACLGSFLGEDWYIEELKKDFPNQHVVAQWHQDFVCFREEGIKKSKGPGSNIPTGNAWSLLTLAYDVYCLKHTNNLDDQFIERLKRYSEFQGVLYEIRTAAIFARLN